VANTADIRNGVVLALEGRLLQVVYFQHVKPGKGSAFVRTKLRDVRTGAQLERTFASGERIDVVDLNHIRIGTASSTTSWTCSRSTM
jgi:elongation factor P